jgi:hypothetical protein
LQKMTRNHTTWGATLLAALTLGCSEADDASQAGAVAPQVAAQGAKYRLTAEPADPTSVAEARKSVADGDEVTVVGCVGGSQKPIVEQAAAFRIADEALVACDDGCTTPWDYCCSANLAESVAMVRVVDQSGATVPTDARQLLGIKESQTVVVQGRAKRDEAGNFTILATGVYVRP